MLAGAGRSIAGTVVGHVVPVDGDRYHATLVGPGKQVALRTAVRTQLIETVDQIAVQTIGEALAERAVVKVRDFRGAGSVFGELQDDDGPALVVRLGDDILLATTRDVVQQSACPIRVTAGFIVDFGSGLRSQAVLVQPAVGAEDVRRGLRGVDDEIGGTIGVGA